MAVLYSFENGGSERMACDVIQHLRDEGYPVEVCATHSAHGPIAVHLEQQGVRCFGIDADARSWAGRRLALFRLFRQRRVEVLFVQHFPMLVLCNVPARLAGVSRLVVTEHTDEQLRSSRKLQRLARRHAIGLDAVTVIHAGLRDALSGMLGITPERVVVIPNGVDTTAFRPRPVDNTLRSRLGATAGQLLVGCVARLHRDKDHRTLLDAVGRLKRSGSAPEFRLALIGDGPEHPDLIALTSALGLRDQVRFLGDRDDVDRLMPQLDLLVLSSRTEGLPLVLLEAMACGIPCLATGVGGIPDLLRRGGGRLAPPENAPALAETLGALLAAPAMLRRLGEDARRIIVAGYDRRTMVGAYQRVLDPDAPATRPVWTPGRTT